MLSHRSPALSHTSRVQGRRGSSKYSLMRQAARVVRSIGACLSVDMRRPSSTFLHIVPRSRGPCGAKGAFSRTPRRHHSSTAQTRFAQLPAPSTWVNPLPSAQRPSTSPIQGMSPTSAGLTKSATVRGAQRMCLREGSGEGHTVIETADGERPRV